MADRIVVWGNCQAEPLARLLTAPLAAHGLGVEIVPAVFLVDEAGLAAVQEVVARSAVLVSQPVRDEYRIPGCGTDQLAAHLPADGRLLTVPVVFHVGAFPYLVNAHGGDGARVDAQLTDYHDLRALVAAERGLTVAEAVAWWPAPTAAAVRAVAETSFAELRRREESVDVPVSPYLDGPDALWTMNHPSNAVLARLADAVLAALDLPGRVEVPEREFLGARRAPLEPAVVAAHGWPATAVRPRWHVEGRDLDLADVLTAHLDFYRRRPDIVADSRTRHAARRTALGLERGTSADGAPATAGPGGAGPGHDPGPPGGDDVVAEGGGPQ